MRKQSQLLLLLMLLNIYSFAQSVRTDTLIMGGSYANEVYYSLENGTVGSSLRNQWDIAFRATILSASIIINDGTNVSLWTYPKADISGWSTLDTSGFYSWNPQYNSITDWESGAFNQYSDNMFDYGWGVYNVSTHNLTGDSIYIIQLRNGSLKKLVIEGKASSENIYSFKFADLDGNEEHAINLECSNYTNRNFIGYSLITNEIVDFENVNSSEWDLLFTKYMHRYDNGTNYPVTGVLSNYNTAVQKCYPVTPEYKNWQSQLMDSSRNAIGFDWKYIDNSFVYHVEDSTVYFVQSKNGDIYKLVFKEFAGSSSGRIVLDKEKISAYSIPQSFADDGLLRIYPNPFTEKISVQTVTTSGKVTYRLNSIDGEKVFESAFESIQEMVPVEISLSGLQSGIYILTVLTDSKIYTCKLIKE